MKAILELAETRRSVRKFSKEKVALEDVLYTLDVARHAPSGANEQPWKFIIVENKDVKRKIKEACEKGEKHLYDNVKGKFKEWLLNKPRETLLGRGPIPSNCSNEKVCEIFARVRLGSHWTHSIGSGREGLENSGLYTI